MLSCEPTKTAETLTIHSKPQFDEWHAVQENGAYPDAAYNFMRGLKNRQDILYALHGMVAVNKPPGVPVHSIGPFDFGVRELLQDGLGIPKINPAHRLDRDTSGVLVFEDRSEGQKSWLPQLFQEREIAKTYIAIVDGKVESKITGIIGPILKNSGEKTVEVITPRLNEPFPDKTKQASTGIHVLARLTDQYTGRDYSVLGVRLFSGRTHQIRAHLSQVLKNPIVGDMSYGGSTDQAQRQFLHAYRLAMPHPDGSGDDLVLKAPIPGDMATFIADKQIMHATPTFKKIFS